MRLPSLLATIRGGATIIYQYPSSPSRLHLLVLAGAAPPFQPYLSRHKLPYGELGLLHQLQVRPHLLLVSVGATLPTLSYLQRHELPRW